MCGWGVGLELGGRVRIHMGLGLEVWVGGRVRAGGYALGWAWVMIRDFRGFHTS